VVNNYFHDNHTGILTPKDLMLEEKNRNFAARKTGKTFGAHGSFRFLCKKYFVIRNP